MVLFYPMMTAQGQLLPSPARMVSFWVGVVTPVFYLPVLFTGIETSVEAVLFVLLLALHAAALVCGHPHNN